MEVNEASVLERAARAACNAAWAGVGEDWSLASDEQQDEFRLMARAVLQAIREPSEAMAEAGARAGVEQIYYKDNAWERCVGDEFKSDHRNYATYSFRAMIDTALTE